MPNRPPRQSQPTPQYTCCVCDHEFAALKTADRHSYSAPRLGDILYCSTCGTVNVLKKGTRLERVTEEFIKTNWTPEEQADLARARGRVSEHWKNKRELN